MVDFPPVVFSFISVAKKGEKFLPALKTDFFEHRVNIFIFRFLQEYFLKIILVECDLFSLKRVNFNHCITYKF
jgi:hypothetical protein